MSYAFDSASLRELSIDLARLTARAAEHERRLSSLVNTMEEGPANDVLRTLRELWVDAREQRRIADTIRARVPGSASPVGDQGRRPLVLIVDDAPDNREMAAMLLDTSGFDTITAGNGLEGVIVAHYTRPAVVIMDVAMPVLDGVQATRLLKASHVTQDINVIAYTAKVDVGGANHDQLFADVLCKPASPDEIIGLVQRYALPSEPESARA